MLVSKIETKNFETITTVDFPQAANRKINMMPFVIGDSTSIPEDYSDYLLLIDACSIEEEEHGKIGFLTITETKVNTGYSQRRGGVHIERHPNNNRWGSGGWGAGKYGSRRQGGIYMASNCSNSTALWDAEVKEPGFGGDVRHLRLGSPDKILDAGELVWMTDATPHESLPIEDASYRQFFRLVTSAVDLWYEQHSTRNSLGVELPENVKIISGNKFS